MRSSTGALRVRYAYTLLALTGALLASGCREDALVANSRSDDAFIRLPGEISRPDIQPKSGVLLPLKPGNQWTYEISTRTGSATEHIVVKGSARYDGVSGQILSIYNSKVERDEVYRLDNSGLEEIASGPPDNMMRISPPIPLVRLPIVEGDSLSWSGLLHFNNNATAATSLSRVSGRERIDTPAGTFDTYRVDTVIMATGSDGVTAPFMTSRWFAPGVGVVQQRLPAEGGALVKRLTRYSVAK